MNYGAYIKEIGRGAHGARNLSRDDARRLYAAMLDGGVPDLELGAILLGFRVKGESPAEMLGFLSALDERIDSLDMPQRGRSRPVILPSYNGARKEPNLTPLLALLLQRLGVPVLVHGLLEGYGRVTSAEILNEFGITPCASVQEAQSALSECGLALLRLTAVCPGLANLLSLRTRMGIRNSAHSLVKLINPFVAGDAVVVAPATHPEFLELMRNLLIERQQRALLLRGTEGECFANPKRCPRLELVQHGTVEVLFEAEHESLRTLPNLPDAADAASTAHWMRRVLGGELPLPQPIARQLACLLYASGHTEDFEQAKAIAAAGFVA